VTSEICLPEIPPVHPQAGQVGGGPAAGAENVLMDFPVVSSSLFGQPSIWINFDLNPICGRQNFYISYRHVCNLN